SPHTQIEVSHRKIVRTADGIARRHTEWCGSDLLPITVQEPQGERSQVDDTWVDLFRSEVDGRFNKIIRANRRNGRTLDRCCRLQIQILSNLEQLGVVRRVAGRVAGSDAKR